MGEKICGILYQGPKNLYESRKKSGTKRGTKRFWFCAREEEVGAEVGLTGGSGCGSIESAKEESRWKRLLLR